MCIRDRLRAAFKSCCPSLEIYLNGGKLLKSKDPEIRETVDRWLKSVEQAGKEMVLQQEVSEDTAAALKMPLMSAQDYVAWLGMV